MPNVLIVFSNSEPDRHKLSEDRWIILKISQDFTGLTDITGDVKKKKKIVKEKEESEESGVMTDDDW